MKLLLAKLWRDMGRQRGPFLAIVLTTLLGVALFGASYDAFQGLQSSYAATFERTRFADLVVSGGDLEGFARQAQATPGVAAVQTRTVADLPFAVGADHRLLGRVVGLPAQEQPTVNQVLVLTGGYLDSARADGVLAEQHFAGHFGLRQGSTLRVLGADGWREVTVMGTVASAEYLWPARSRQEILTTPDSFGVLFVPEALARQLAPPQVRSEALVLFGPAVDRAALTTKLREAALRVGASDVVTQADQPSNAALREDIDGFGEMALMFPVLFLGAAGLTIFVVLGRLVQAQRSQIGMLRANGVGVRPILLHYASFGVVACLVGGLLGALLGLPLGQLITSAYTGALSIPITVIRLQPLTALAGTDLALVAGVLAAARPALGAARVLPAEAMRGVAPTSGGRASWLQRLLPVLNRLSPKGKYVLRTLGRQPRRSLSVALGVILASTLVLVSWGMLDTVQVLLDRQFQQVAREDARLYAEQSLDAGLLTAVGQTLGVKAVELAAELPVSLRFGDKTYRTALVGLQSPTQMHAFLTSGSGTVPLPADGVLVGAALRTTLGVPGW
ncbi:MAG: FtsX-like permease family protein [Chloroflexota bacterium]